MDSFDFEILKWIAMSGIGFVLWWLKSTITKLQDEVNTIKAEYLHKTDFRDFKLDLFRSLDEIKKDIRRLIDFKDSQ